MGMSATRAQNGTVVVKCISLADSELNTAMVWLVRKASIAAFFLTKDQLTIKPEGFDVEGCFAVRVKYSDPKSVVTLPQLLI